eukprot:TRINITY_DN3407_c0_g1_i1.p1 TRINITY_DN3407_c0_g1~~TRINITY_DN3407_c0_g1_i1.p1  ORF type:complete len:490 (+),score=184.63 TRINITY_DN3407_c0_g1_i1:75-1472(+)
MPAEVRPIATQAPAAGRSPPARPDANPAEVSAVSADASCFAGEEAAYTAAEFAERHSAQCDQGARDCAAVQATVEPDFVAAHRARTLRRQREGEAEELEQVAARLRAALAESNAAVEHQCSLNQDVSAQAVRSQRKIADLQRLAAPLLQRLTYRKGSAPEVVTQCTGAGPPPHDSMALVWHCAGAAAEYDGVVLSVPTRRAEQLQQEVTQRTAALADLLERRAEQRAAFEAATARAAAAERESFAERQRGVADAERRARQAWDLAARAAVELCTARVDAMRNQRRLWREERQLLHQIEVTEAELRDERSRRAEEMEEAVERAVAELAEERGRLTRERQRCDSAKGEVLRRGGAAAAAHGERLRQLEERVHIANRQAERIARARRLDVAGFHEEIKVMERQLAAAERRVTRARRASLAAQVQAASTAPRSAQEDVAALRRRQEAVAAERAAARSYSAAHRDPTRTA